MKKLLLTCIALTALNVNASQKEATLVCGEIASVNIPSQYINGKTFAKLETDLSGKYADVTNNDPLSPGSFVFNLSFNKNVLPELPLRDFYILSRRDSYMKLDRANSLRFGMYKLNKGILSLIDKGAATLEINVLKEGVVYSRQYDDHKPSLLSNVAEATLTFDRGDEIKTLCHFRFYGE